MNETTAKPRRRWFLPRFSLRTMFVVVTVFSLWLGWQAKIVRDRREMISDLQRQGIPFFSRTPFFKPKIPIWRRWLGDQPIGAAGMRIDRLSSSKLAEFKRLFPEAELWPDMPYVKFYIRSSNEVEP